MLSDNQNPAIRISNLVAGYSNQRILDGIDLSVEPGEVMAIMGESGTGKSLLMRCMLGLHKPHSGTVRLLGMNLLDLSRKQQRQLRSKVGVAFQGGALFSSMSLLENIELPLHELTRLDHSTIRIMAQLKLEMVGLGDFAELMPSELSGGMLKRSALARAIIMDPQVLLIDEPSSGLDPITAVEMDELILNLRQALNMTIVVVTHAVESAVKVADRITVLSAGKIVVCDTVPAVRNFDNKHVQNLLHRKPGGQKTDLQDYLQRLVSSV